MINERILNIIKSGTNFTEVTTDNIVMALSCCGWNYKIYNGFIYLKKEKIAISDEDLSFMRSGIPAYNADKPSYRHIEF